MPVTTPQDKWQPCLADILAPCSRVHAQMRGTIAACEAMAGPPAGQGEPVQDAQKAAQSQGGPSGPSQGPGKPEKGKADKMQQQAAGSQSAAQMAKVRQ